jgi:hypothetical protein
LESAKSKVIRWSSEQEQEITTVPGGQIINAAEPSKRPMWADVLWESYQRRGMKSDLDAPSYFTKS